MGRTRLSLTFVPGSFPLQTRSGEVCPTLGPGSVLMDPEPASVRALDRSHLCSLVRGTARSCGLRCQPVLFPGLALITCIEQETPVLSLQPMLHRIKTCRAVRTGGTVLDAGKHATELAANWTQPVRQPLNIFLFAASVPLLHNEPAGTTGVRGPAGRSL